MLIEYTKNTKFSRVSGFGPGAIIMTTDGEMPVEWLAVGDRVITRDHGAQPVLWVKRSRQLGPEGFCLSPPLRVNRGEAAGQGDLQESLRLSPHHKVLVRGAHVALHFGVDEALAEVGDLSRRSTWRKDKDIALLTYTHIMTARHEVIWVCGMWAETTCPAVAQQLAIPVGATQGQPLFRPGARTCRPCLNRDGAQMLRDLLLPGESLLHLIAA